MSVFIPYPIGLSLGYSLEWTSKSNEIRTAKDKSSQTEWKKPKVEARCKVVENIEDICKFLETPPELALKVEIGQMDNIVMKNIVTDLYDENVIIAIFQVKVCLCVETLTQQGPSVTGTNFACGDNGKDTAGHNTSVVTARELGNELTVVLKLKCQNAKTVTDIFEPHLSMIGSNFWHFGDKLTLRCKTLDKVLEENKDVEMNVTYFGFQALPTLNSPGPGISDMMEIIKDFRSELCKLQDDSEKKFEFVSSPIKPQCSSHQTSCTGNPIQSPLPDPDEKRLTMYLLRVVLDHRTSDIPQYSYDIAEELLKRMKAGEKALEKIRQINDPRFVAITNPAVYKIQERTNAVKESLEEINELIKGLHLNQWANIERICQDDKIQQCLKVQNGDMIDLLLLGKTGNGKSSLGNSILVNNEFKSSANGSSETLDCKRGCGMIDDRSISVMDTPGALDTRLTFLRKIAGDAEIRKIFTDIIMMSDFEYYHAFLFVIKYGERLTDESHSAIKMFKDALGIDAIKSHGICVITGGDTFREGSEKIFHEWCQKTGSDFLDELIKECQYRCVLFDNKIQNKDVKRSQLLRLLSLVDGINSRYTGGLFDRTSKIREEFLKGDDYQTLIRNICYFFEIALDEVKKGRKLDNETMRIVKLFKGPKVKFASKDSEIILKLLKNIEGGTSEHEIDEETKKRLNRRGNEAENDLKKWEKAVEKQVSESSCFPSCSRLQTDAGRKVKLEDVSVGDKVLARGKDGKLFYDTIYMFGHQDRRTYEQFLIIETPKQNIAITDNHVVFCTRNGVQRCVAARFITPGDKLTVAVSENSVELQSVLRVSFERKRGLFAPFTMSGNVVVDDILVSCYVDVVSHSTAHRALAPMRQLYNIAPKALAFINGRTGKTTVPMWARVVVKGLSFFQTVKAKIMHPI